MAVGTLAAAGAIVAPTAPAQAAEGQLFTYTNVVMDENGLPVQLPPDEPWDVTATGPATYSNRTADGEVDNPWALLADDPTPGAYTLTAVPHPNQSVTSTGILCTYVDLNDPDNWSEAEVRGVAGAWQVDVHAEMSTSCFETYEFVGATPDPQVTGQIIFDPATDENRDQVHVGAASDFLFALKDASGNVVATAQNGEIQVAPGEYWPALVAAPDAQSGFDLADWTVSQWSCVEAPSESLELRAGQRVTCQAAVTDADHDLSLSADLDGDVSYVWDGITGPVGTPFEVILDVSQPAASLYPSAASGVEVVAQLGDNMAPRDPFVLTPGFELVSSDGGDLVFATDEVLQPGDSMELRLALEITAVEPTTAFRSCVRGTSGLLDQNPDNNCIELHAVADGGDPSPSPDPTPSSSATPSPSASPSPSDSASPSPSPSGSASPNPSASPSPSDSASPSPTDDRDPDRRRPGLPSTGA